MRIQVYPEQLRETAQVLRRAVDLWAEQSAYLGRALNSLNWEVRERARVEGQVAQAIRLAQALAERVGTQAAFLEEAAARFEAADQQGVQGVNAVIETVGKLPDLPSWLSLPRHPALSLGALFGTGSIAMLRLRPSIGGISGVWNGIGESIRGSFGSAWESVEDFAERVWNWLKGHGWKTDEELQKPRERKPTPRPSPEPAPPESKVRPPGGKKESISLEKNAPTNDCVLFVTAQRKALGKRVPYGFSDKQVTWRGKSYPGFYTGAYKGNSGTLPDGTEYGQEPKVGAIMVESPNPKVEIFYGHASFVYEVERDATDKVIRFKVAEGNWGDPQKLHTEEFGWDEAKQCYVSSSGNRVPDMFIY